jgi:hypothetical protein
MRQLNALFWMSLVSLVTGNGIAYGIDLIQGMPLDGSR